MGSESPTSRPSSEKKVVVLGGGLAGLSAARRLLQLGFGVTLVEKRAFLGGRAFSFRDRESGIEIDNGQHVFLACNTHYIDYLRDINVIDKTYIQDRFRVQIIRDGVSGELSSTPWLGPMHLLPSFFKYPHLSLFEKLSALYGLMSMKLTNHGKNSADIDHETAYEWLKRHGQNDRAIENIWNLFILPALNDNVRSVSAGEMIRVFQEALLKNPSDSRIGVAKIGLTSLNGEPAQAYIEAHGGNLSLGTGVKSICVKDSRVQHVEMQDGSKIASDVFISALPFEVMLEILPEPIVNQKFFSRLHFIETAPIVGLNLWYNKPIMDQAFVAFLNSSVQWVFNKSLIQGSDVGTGQHVYISLSAAWEHVNDSKEKLRESFTEEMARLFPAARHAKVTRFLAVKERQATFRSLPGTSQHRPNQITPISNLFQAGDWTQTGLPSTMESAVLSGVLAAEALAKNHAHH
jgi:squalene-associated FAD-dependent desaturase